MWVTAGTTSLDILVERASNFDTDVKRARAAGQVLSHGVEVGLHTPGSRELYLLATLLLLLQRLPAPMRLAAASQASMIRSVAPRSARRPARTGSTGLRAVAAADPPEEPTPGPGPTPGQVKRGHSAKGAEGWKGERAGLQRSFGQATMAHTIRAF